MQTQKCPLELLELSWKEGECTSGGCQLPDSMPGPRSIVAEPALCAGRVCSPALWGLLGLSLLLSRPERPTNAFLQTEVLPRLPPAGGLKSIAPVHTLRRTSCGHGGKDTLRREADVVGRQLFKPSSRTTDQPQVRPSAGSCGQLLRGSRPLRGVCLFLL